LNPSEQKALLRTIAPFDRLAEHELAQAAAVLALRHYAPGQTILRRWANPAYLYIVTDGVVAEADADGIVCRYVKGDIFDARSLIEGRSQHRFVAQSKCSCYLMPARLFLALSRAHPPIRDYFCQDLVRKLDALVAVQQQREAASFMLARIGENELHPVVYVTPETSIEDAATHMQSQQTTALLVQRDDQVGIFTTRDFREKILLAGSSASLPVGEVANYDLITLEQDDFLFNALVLMTKHAIRHIVITRDREIVGILEQIDLLRYLSNHSYLIANRIDRATSRQELKEANSSVPTLIKSLHDRGVKPRYIARLVTDLNRKLFRQLYEQIAPPALINDACLIVMGSEGRGEQLLRTDQDNALILRKPYNEDALKGITAAFTNALIELGFPRCPGNIMVSNPAWAKTLEAYKNNLFRWIHYPDETARMNLAIFFDATAAAGDKTLLEELRDYLFYLLQNSDITLQHFAKATVAFETPLGWFDRFVVQKGNHKNQLDIKKGGIFPIVHGVRSLALQYRLSQTSTIARIQALSGRTLFDEHFTADLIEAFEFMSMLRLRTQLMHWEQGEKYDNYLNPYRLNKLERNLLKDSLKIVKTFKSFISYHFKLSMVS